MLVGILYKLRWYVLIELLKMVPLRIGLFFSFLCCFCDFACLASGLTLGDLPSDHSVCFIILAFKHCNHQLQWSWILINFFLLDIGVNFWVKLEDFFFRWTLSAIGMALPGWVSPHLSFSHEYPRNTLEFPLYIFPLSLLTIERKDHWNAKLPQYVRAGGWKTKRVLFV